MVFWCLWPSCGPFTVLNTKNGLLLHLRLPGEHQEVHPQLPQQVEIILFQWLHKLCMWT